MGAGDRWRAGADSGSGAMTLHRVRGPDPGAQADDHLGMMNARLSWVVCRGKTRDASGGRVTCPRRGALNSETCLHCHLLVTMDRERDLLLACSTVEGRRDGPNEGETDASEAA